MTMGASHLDQVGRLTCSDQKNLLSRNLPAKQSLVYSDRPESFGFICIKVKRVGYLEEIFAG